MDEDLPDGSSICHVISRLRYKDNTAETTAVETTAKAEDTKETETEKQKRQPGLQQVKQQKLQRQPRKTVNWIWQQLQESTM